jgi:hypothetical protein
MLLRNILFFGSIRQFPRAGGKLVYLFLQFTNWSLYFSNLVLLSGWGYMVPLTCCFVFWTYSSFNVNIGVLLMIVCDDLILSTPFPSATVKSRKFRRGGGKSLNFWTHQYKFKWLYRFKNYPKDSWNLVAQSTAVKSRGLLRFPRSPTTKHGT